jgi:hypothetical protein
VGAQVVGNRFDQRLARKYQPPTALCDALAFLLLAKLLALKVSLRLGGCSTLRGFAGGALALILFAGQALALALIGLTLLLGKLLGLVLAPAFLRDQSRALSRFFCGLAGILRLLRLGPSAFVDRRSQSAGTLANLGTLLGKGLSSAQIVKGPIVVASHRHAQ